MCWKNKLFIFFLTFVSIFPLTEVYGEDNSMEFSIIGGVWLSGCGLDSDFKTIDLGTYHVNQFNLPNQVSQPVRFTLKINNGCYFGSDLPTGIIPNELARARLVFEDVSQGDEYGEYIDDALRTKSGIGVQVGFSQNDPLPFRSGKTNQIGIPEENYSGGQIGEDQFIFLYAWMWSGENPSPVAGDVSASMVVKLEYY